MSESEVESIPGEGSGGSRGSRAEQVRRAAAELPRWKKVLLAVAGLFVLVGSGLALTSDPEPEPTVATSGGNTPLTSNLRSTSSTGTSGAETETSAGNAWSPFFLKGGFSFFMGFTVGYAARKFMKLALFVVGGLAIVLFLLSYAELIAIDWTTMEGYYDSIAAQLSTELEHFQTFIAGSLPSAGLTGLGLFTGFKKG